MLLVLISLCALVQLAAGAQLQSEIDLTNTTIRGFGQDFASELLHNTIFQYGLAVPNNAEVSFTILPNAGIKCGYEGNTNNECAGLVHYFTMPGVSLDFDGRGQRQNDLTSESRHLQEQVAFSIEIDFAIVPEPMETSLPDLQHYPAFVLGVAACFNIPGVTQLALTKEVTAGIFRACTYVNTTEAPTTNTDSPTSMPTSSPSASPTQSPTAANATFVPTLDSRNSTAMPTSNGVPDNSSIYCLPGAVTRWDDPRILASNPVEIHPYLIAAGPIKVFVGGESNSVAAHAFKKALSRSDEAFRQQVGDEQNAIWRGANVEHVFGSYGPIRKVATTPGSISYASTNQISQQSDVYAVDLMADNGFILSPNTKALAAAFAEVGLDFGNDGRDKSMLTIDLTGASGINSWPISMMAYLTIRKDHTSDNCFMRKLALLSYLEYVSLSMATAESRGGLALLTPDAGAQILAIQRAQLKCDGKQVYEAPKAPPNVEVYADHTLHSLLGTFLQNSATGDYTVEVLPTPTHVSVRDSWSCMANISSCPFGSDMVVFADENLSSNIIEDAKTRDYEILAFPYVAVATGFIHNFCTSSGAVCNYRYNTPFVLDVTTAANILDGKIRWWNDTAILKLNPTKLVPNERIVVVPGPKYSDHHLSFVQKVRSSYVPDFAYRAGDNVQRTTFIEAWMDVSLIPYSISFAVLNGTSVDGVERIALRNDQGIDVTASPESIEACAYDTYDEKSYVFRLAYSVEPDCYPLITTYNMIVTRKSSSPIPAFMLKGLYDQSLRTAQGKTAVYTNGFGTLIDLQLDGLDIAEISLLGLYKIVSAETGVSYLLVPHQLNHIPEGAIQAMYAVLALELFCFMWLAFWTLANKNRKLIYNSSPSFMIQILFGAAVMACTVIPLSFQDDYLSPNAMTKEEIEMNDNFLNGACVADPLLFSMGFFITFSAMFLKSWRLIRIFNNAKLKNLFLKDRQLMLYQTGVIMIVVVLNALWAGIDPMVWVRIPEYENAEGLVVGSSGICYSRGGIASAMPLIIGIVLILVVGNYLAYLGRMIPTEFNESKWTAMAMTMILEAVIIAVPVLVLSNNDPVAGFIIKSLVSLLIAGATVGLIFIPKILLAYGIGEAKGESNPWRFVRASDSSNNTNNHSKKVAVQQNAMLSQIVGSNTNHEIQFLSSPSLMSVTKTSNPVASTAHKSFPAASASTSQALARVLQDDPSRRKFRRYLKTLKMEENVRFWDATMITKAETNESKRYSGTRAVIQSFVMDNSPFQVNLSSATKQTILAVYNADDKEKLKDPTFFDQAMAEMFDDLRQSDAFRAFLENDTFSTQNLT